MKNCISCSFYICRFLCNVYWNNFEQEVFEGHASSLYTYNAPTVYTSCLIHSMWWRLFLSIDNQMIDWGLIQAYLLYRFFAFAQWWLIVSLNCYTDHLCTISLFLLSCVCIATKGLWFHHLSVVEYSLMCVLH